MSDSHKVRATSWAVVVIIVVGAILLGFALPLKSLPLAIAGGVVFLVGVVMGGVTKVMDDAH